MKTPSNNPYYIAVEGPIGVGKTTLANRLAKTFDAGLGLEAPSDNPFLPRFYAEQQASALPTQLHFLFQRLAQIGDFSQKDLFKPSMYIADFLFEKDKLFAQVTLSKDELAIYNKVYNLLVTDIPKPDLVIYLQASPDILIKRVRRRNIDYEKTIDQAYLTKISDAYIDFFHHYDRTSLLIVNTQNFNIITGDREYKLLLDKINNPPSGRLYLNSETTCL